MKKVLQIKYDRDVTKEELDRISRKMVDLDPDILVIITPDSINMKELSLSALIEERKVIESAIREKLDDYCNQSSDTAK